MNKSCSLKAKVRDKNTGKLTSKDSLLHKGLTVLSKFCPGFNRNKANNVLCIAQTNYFQEHFKDDLVFDLNEEPNLTSVWETLKTDEMSEVTISLMRDCLAERFSEGYYSYEDAYNKALEFNKALEGSKTFIGAVVYDENARAFKFEIQYNSKENQEAFIKLVEDVKFNTILTLKLESLGVGIDELDSSKTSAKGMYNTINPNRVNMGLLGIIALRDTTFDFDTLCHETGHFIIGSLENKTNLIPRLINLIKEHPLEIMDLIGTEEYNLITNNNASTRNLEAIYRELAGQLVSKFLREEIAFKQKPVYKQLLSRIWLFAKNFFNSITSNFFTSAQLQARYTARLMASSFLGSNFDGTLDNALNRAELLKSENKGYREVLGSIARTLQLLSKELESVGSYERSTLLKNKINILLSAYLLPSTEISSAKMAEIVAKSLAIVAKEVLLVCEDLSYYESSGPITISDWKECAELIVRYDKLIALTRSFTEGRQNGLDIVMDLIRGEATDSPDRDEMIRYLGSIEELSRLFREFTLYESGINTLSYKMATSFCKEITGYSAFYVPLYKTWNNRKEETVIEIENYLLEAAIEDLGIISEWIYSMGNSPDIINLVVKMSVELATHKADVKASSFSQRMKALYNEWHTVSKGKATNVLCEVDENGVYTSNLVSESRIGEWEHERQKHRNEAIKRFMDLFVKSKDNPDGKYFSRIQAFKSSEFKLYIKAIMKEFHDAHSMLEDITDSKGNPQIDPFSGEIRKKWVPYNSLTASLDLRSASKKDYYNEEYFNKFTQEERAIIDKIRNAKLELDELLPPKARNTNRIPQYRKNYMGAILSSFKKGQVSIAFKSAILRSYLNRICSISAEVDSDYGGDYYRELDEQSLKEENLFGHLLNEQLRLVRSVPLYGTKKLLNPGDMTTDPFAALVAYGAMAYSYDAMNEVATACIAVKHNNKHSRQVNKSTVLADSANSNKKTGSKYLEQLEDYLDLQVYKIRRFLTSDYDSKYKYKRAIIATLICKGWAHATSLFLLGGNTTSALINLGTAINQMWQEAGAGYNYNRKDFTWALALYTMFMCHCFAGSLIGAVNPLCSRLGVPLNNTAFSRTGHVVENITKLSLFAKRYNIGDRNNWKNFNFDRFGHMFVLHMSYTDGVMAPYSMQEGFIQTMAYLSAAHHIKVVLQDSKGDVKEVSLWNAYEVRNDELHFKEDYTYYLEDTNASNVYRVKNKESLITEHNGYLDDKYKEGDILEDESTSIHYDDGLKRFISEEAIIIKIDDENGTYTTKKVVRIYANMLDKDAHSDAITAALHVRDATSQRAHYEGDFVEDEDLKEESEGYEDAVSDDYVGVTDIGLIHYNIEKLRYERTDTEYVELILSTPGGDISLALPCKYEVKYITRVYHLKDDYIPTPAEDQENIFDNILDEDRKVIKGEWNRMESLIIALIRGVNNRLHGVYNSADAGKICNTAYGAVALCLKKYFIGLFEKRFRSARYSLLDNDIVEGSYRTFLKIIWALCTNKSDKEKSIPINILLNTKCALSLITAAFIPIGMFSKTLVDNPLKKLGFSDFQVSNYKRVYMDMAASFFLLLIANMLLPSEPPEPTDEELNALTKSEFLAYAEAIGVTIEGYTARTIPDDKYRKVVREVLSIRNTNIEKEKEREDQNFLYSFMDFAGDAYKAHIKGVNPSKIKKSNEYTLEELKNDYPILGKAGNTVLNILSFGTMGAIDTGNNSVINAWNQFLTGNYFNTGLGLKIIADDKMQGGLSNYEGEYKYKLSKKKKTRGLRIHNIMTGKDELNTTESAFSLKGIGYLYSYALWAENAPISGPLYFTTEITNTALGVMFSDDITFSDGFDAIKQTAATTIGEWLGISEIFPLVAIPMAAIMLMDDLKRLPLTEEGYYNPAQAMKSPDSYVEQQGNFEHVARWRHLIAKYTPYLRSSLLNKYAYKAAQGRQYGRFRTLGFNIR